MTADEIQAEWEAAAGDLEFTSEVLSVEMLRLHSVILLEVLRRLEQIAAMP